MKPPALTRRALARFAALPLILSTKAPGQTPPAPARNQFQAAAQQLSGVKLARNVEPATRFEA